MEAKRRCLATMDIFKTPIFLGFLLTTYKKLLNYRDFIGLAKICFVKVFERKEAVGMLWTFLEQLCLS